MGDELRSRSCVPCRGGIPPLTQDAAEALLKQVRGWTLVDGARRLEKSFSFRNFKEALDFVLRVGELSESEGHHPDLSFGWGWAKVSWHTKKIKGLHENDFIMAAKTDLASGA
jgi:4a-hydroxytetrahydrobiopterin dehydratase